jgi:hypothetical protein
MQQPAPSIEGTRRFLRTVNLVLLASMILDVWAAEKLFPHEPRTLNRIMATEFAVMGAAMLGIAFFARKKMVGPALDALQFKPDDVSSLTRWRAGNILSYILMESVVLFGFALRFLGGTLAQSVPFYAVGLGLMLLWWPREA